MKDVKDMVWAYLHDELSAADQHRFEEALSTDETLRSLLNECRTTHDEITQLADEQLTDQLLAEWESEHPEFAEKREAPPKGRIIRFTLPLAAAAAAAVIMLQLLPLQQEPIHWQRTAYGSAPQLRGELGADLMYSRSELRQIDHELRKAINDELRSRPEPEPWSLQIRLQELADGYIAIEVSGSPKENPEALKIWQATFQGLREFQTNLPEFSERIVTDLVARDIP
ncbi:MAG: zf-HC2 domain-containing protein [Pontiellaceae bacterium]|nr:zf-HC2 domain-containing protein [Pontiellaceae bacterium]MBN2783682.1 zf-HC2 domain-containing protein [Pontiellaceae bacterium]